MAVDVRDVADRGRVVVVEFIGGRSGTRIESSFLKFVHCGNLR